MSVHCIYNFQTGDFSVSLKASGHIKHFRVHVEGGMYCMGQREFVSLQQLVDHYQVREAKREQVVIQQVIFSERTNLHITARGKAVPHQAPFRECIYTYLVSKSGLQNKLTHSTWSSFQFLWPVLFYLIQTIFAAEHGLVWICVVRGLVNW